MLSKSLGIINEDSSNAIIIPTAYHQGRFRFKFSRFRIDFMETKHIQFKRTNEMCLTLDKENNQRWYPVQGLIDCGIDSRCIQPLQYASWIPS
jgi:hypothetical protein